VGLPEVTKHGYPRDFPNLWQSVQNFPQSWGIKPRPPNKLQMRAPPPCILRQIFNLLAQVVSEQDFFKWKIGGRLRRLACGTRKWFLKIGLRHTFFRWPGVSPELFEQKQTLGYPWGVFITFGTDFLGQSSDGSQICVRHTTSAKLKLSDRGNGPLLRCKFELPRFNHLGGRIISVIWAGSAPTARVRDMQSAIKN